MPNVKLTIEYDGTDFCGFQKQPCVRTIQGEMERALQDLFRQAHVKVIGSGRTDAGVHAIGQVVNFAAPEQFPVDRICPALNGLLPESIKAKDAFEVSADFHARYSAKSRTYVYVVLNRVGPSALLPRYTWHVIRPLDIEAMQESAAKLIGVHDFASFGVPEREGGSSIREIFGFELKRKKDGVFFTVRANAFLRGMVRSMVGTLVEIGQGKRKSEEIVDILAARDRQSTGASAPPQGLFLMRVEY